MGRKYYLAQAAEIAVPVSFTSERATAKALPKISRFAVGRVAPFFARISRRGLVSVL